MASWLIALDSLGMNGVQLWNCKVLLLYNKEWIIAFSKYCILNIIHSLPFHKGVFPVQERQYTECKISSLQHGDKVPNVDAFGVS